VLETLVRPRSNPRPSELAASGLARPDRRKTFDAKGFVHGLRNSRKTWPCASLTSPCCGGAGTGNDDCAFLQRLRQDFFISERA
jgi:hypothetical protein